VRASSKLKGFKLKTLKDPGAKDLAMDDRPRLRNFAAENCELSHFSAFANHCTGFERTGSLFVADNSIVVSELHGYSLLLMISVRGSNSISWPKRSNVTTPGRNIKSS
jgi:hypothetical protein